MKKTLPLFVFFVLTSLHASAQEGSRYRFDNFDTREGVRVQTPAQSKPAPRGKRLRLTARTVERQATPATCPFSGSLNTNAATPSPAAPAATAKSLGGFSTGDAAIDSYIADSGTRNGVDPVLL